MQISSHRAARAALVAPAAVVGTLLACVLGCGGGGSGRAVASTAAPVASATATTAAVGSVAEVVFQPGADLAPAAALRVADLLRRSDPRPLTVLAPTDPLPALAPGSLVLAVGEAEVARGLISAAERAALAGEGFVVRSAARAGVDLVAADGAPAAHGHGPNRGLLYGTYAALEALGVAFLHPLAPTLPAALAPPAAPLDRREAPRWPQRGLHLHTMHPLELTHLLQGWGPAGPQDAAGWAAMLPEWDLFCEWAIANRQNEVEWVLLRADSWGAFADGPERMARLTELVRRAHAWGLEVGVDVPIALKQQHAATLIRETGDPARELDQLHAGLDRLLACGFDFVATELGFSEFTAPDARRMLAWLDAFTERVVGHHGKRAWTKIHVSTGQEARGFTDPDTGGPLNFNFLPFYADPRLGVMPHTVQHYALDDPAPTYGNRDFSEIRRYLQLEAGARPVLWHPETAYWVSFDVDVPLFLPVYAERRVRDLRLIAADEAAGRTGRGARAGSPIQGQMIFSSGWEWGYWLNDVVTARAAWDPHEAAPDDAAALRALLVDALRPAFGAATDDLADLLVATAAEQRALLIDGEVGGRRPADVERRNGQAYLQGWETWDDVASSLQGVPGLPQAATQPFKLGLVDMRAALQLRPLPDYRAEVAPLLAEMDRRFAATALAWDAQRARAPASTSDLIDDLADAARVTALRAAQVHGLYEYVARRRDRAAARPHLDRARRALDDAAAVVAAREPRYRVPADRVAAWAPNPTVYRFGYLWTVRSLHFWWRDEGKAVDAPWSPAYLNVIDPLRTAFGEGFWIPLSEWARAFGQRNGLGPVTDLLAAPAQEPSYPPAGLRSRP